MNEIKIKLKHKIGDTVYFIIKDCNGNFAVKEDVIDGVNIKILDDDEGQKQQIEYRTKHHFWEKDKRLMSDLKFANKICKQLNKIGYTVIF